MDKIRLRFCIPGFKVDFGLLVRQTFNLDAMQQWTNFSEFLRSSINRCCKFPVKMCYNSSSRTFHKQNCRRMQIFVSTAIATFISFRCSESRNRRFLIILNWPPFRDERRQNEEDKWDCGLWRCWAGILFLNFEAFSNHILRYFPPSPKPCFPQIIRLMPWNCKNFNFGSFEFKFARKPDDFLIRLFIHLPTWAGN